MDRDLVLKFNEDKERGIKELCHHLSLACSSIVTHEGNSGTHDLREEPLMTTPHEEYSELQVYEESFDTDGFDRVPIFHCRDHESFCCLKG
jgi:hypothetical protein